MNQIQIQGTEIQIKEYNGQRVVTFKDIDTVHKRPDGTARKRFSDNRKRFIEGVDYYKVKCSEVRPFFGQTTPNGFNPNGDITLITESGYLMLVKSFTDDLAWKVQRELVDTYFRVRAVADQTVTVTETVHKDGNVPELYLEASKIMAGCLEGNRPYVLNILRHVVPDIDATQDKAQKVLEISTAVKDGPKKKTNHPVSQGVPIDIPKLLEEMGNQNVSVETLASKANVSSITISNWIAGKHQPVLQNRINVCVALGKDKDFLTPKRKRNVR